MTTVEVLVGDAGRSRLVGQAHFTRGRQGVSTTFVYDANYLAKGGPNVDPRLRLTSGPQHQRGLVGAFADGAPDRWGRNLLDRAEQVTARAEGRTARGLDDVDYLLGVSDDARQGALRYRLPGKDTFLGEPARVPKLVSLPQLLRASDALGRGGDAAEAVKQLLDTGTSGLGGARPKAAVRFDDDGLALAKFPHATDEWDVMAWEATALDLLEEAGIAAPEHRLTRVGDRSLHILRRFDRTNSGERIGYISAMTATGSGDGDRRDYVDIAEAIRDLSTSPRKDHLELFDRVVASVVLGNVDDHLRNHGFLAEGDHWQLSPAFDVNPNPGLAGRRATSIAGVDEFPDEVDGLFALAEDCGLRAAQACDRMSHVADSLARWREAARRNAIAEREITMMADGIEPRLEAVAEAARR